MKTIAFTILMLSSAAFAGNFKEISIMAGDSVLEYLSDGDHTYQILKQQLIRTEGNSSFAVETTVQATSIHSARVTVWNCISQFVKTNDFFEVSKTGCKQ